MRQVKDQREKGASSTRKKYKFYDQLLFLEPFVDSVETKETVEEAVDLTDFLQQSILEQDSVNTSAQVVNADDGDKHFALSIIPMLEQLPCSEKLELRLNILHIIKERFNAENAKKRRIAAPMVQPTFQCPRFNIDADIDSDDSDIQE